MYFVNTSMKIRVIFVVGCLSYKLYMKHSITGQSRFKKNKLKYASVDHVQ